jgi:putative endonuclease
MSDVRSTLGADGEQAALDVYRRRGFTLVARNWRCSIGEIDLVLRRGDVLVFCEVKTRRGSRHGHAFEAVDARKRRKVRVLAEVFLLTEAVGAAAVRFDVAGVSAAGGPTGRRELRVEIIEDAF